MVPALVPYVEAISVIRRSNNTDQSNRAAGYVRRSTDRQEQSIPVQKKALELYVVEHDLRLVKFYVDDAISGASTVGRRAFQQMMKDAQSSARNFGIYNPDMCLSDTPDPISRPGFNDRCTASKTRVLYSLGLSFRCRVPPDQQRQVG
jgi:hypothetical protein